MAVIYKATNNFTNQSYIGYTIDFERRRFEHEQRARLGIGRNFEAILSEVGHENFTWTILLEDATMDDEIRLITEHKTHVSQGGYNVTSGGNGNAGYVFTEEHKTNISKGRKGWKMSDDQKSKLSAYHKTQIGEKNPFYGKKHSDQTKEKMRIAKLGKPSPKTKRRAPATEESRRKMAESARLAWEKRKIV